MLKSLHTTVATPLKNLGRVLPHRGRSSLHAETQVWWSLVEAAAVSSSSSASDSEDSVPLSRLFLGAYRSFGMNTALTPPSSFSLRKSSLFCLGYSSKSSVGANWVGLT